jgi:hypothetical protein
MLQRARNSICPSTRAHKGGHMLHTQAGTCSTHLGLEPTDVESLFVLVKLCTVQI